MQGVRRAARRLVRCAGRAAVGGRPLLARVGSCVLAGLEGQLVQVEVDVSPGVPAFELVGLPQTTVREARERVRAAIRRSGFDFPLRRITVNLAPPDLRKEGAQLDLALAVGVLAASGQVTSAFGDARVFLGGLGLDGRVEAVRGILPMARACALAGLRHVVVAAGNAADAALVEELEVTPVRSLAEAVAVLRGEGPAPVAPGAGRCAGGGGAPGRDLAEVRGLAQARLALEVAAAGGHHLLLVGPPGAGKTLLASCLPGILPGMTREEALEVTAIHDLAGLLPAGSGLVSQRPFRAPHHTVSLAGLLGGGGERPRPGELSLAHRGVLFLDEFPELARPVREALRQPLEEGRVVVARRHWVGCFPARFTLVASANPCPCGQFGCGDGSCTCTPGVVDRYRARLSGPVLDRLDLQVRVERPRREASPGEPSARVRRRVEAARERQRRRFRGATVTCNAELAGAALRRFVRVDAEAEVVWQEEVESLGLSPRAAEGVLRVARTMADLAGREEVTADDVHAALSLRFPDGHRGRLPAAG